MKRTSKVLGAMLIIAVFAITMAFVFAGCGKTDSVKAAFKSAGYEVSTVAAEDCNELTALLKTEEQKATIGKYKVYTFKSFERTATVVKFPSVKTMQEILGESTFKSKTDGGYVNGECYLIKSCTDALYVFKNA